MPKLVVRAKESPKVCKPQRKGGIGSRVWSRAVAERHVSRGRHDRWEAAKPSAGSWTPSSAFPPTTLVRVHYPFLTIAVLASHDGSQPRASKREVLERSSIAGGVASLGCPQPGPGRTTPPTRRSADRANAIGSVFCRSLRTALRRTCAPGKCLANDTFWGWPRGGLVAGSG